MLFHFDGLRKSVKDFGWSKDIRNYSLAHKHVHVRMPLKSAFIFVLGTLTSALPLDKSSLELCTQRWICLKATPKLEQVVSYPFPTDFVQDVFHVGGVELRDCYNLRCLYQVDQEIEKFHMDHFHKFVFKTCDLITWFVSFCTFMWISNLSQHFYSELDVPKNQPTHPICCPQFRFHVSSLFRNPDGLWDVFWGFLREFAWCCLVSWKLKWEVDRRFMSPTYSTIFARWLGGSRDSAMGTLTGRSPGVGHSVGVSRTRRVQREFVESKETQDMKLMHL